MGGMNNRPTVSAEVGIIDTNNRDTVNGCISDKRGNIVSGGGGGATVYIMVCMDEEDNG